ncbi:MAG: 4Fe-4S ferredoxin [Actinobacteria bacterium]|nr:4Fe-4S ferredoxin [Actinomycetota bacterium]
MEKEKLKIIKKNDVLKFLDSLQKEYEVFMPVERNGDIQFSKFSSEKDFPWNYRNTKISPKEIFFPQSETLFSFKAEESALSSGSMIFKPEDEPEDSISENKNYLIFGIRPCDTLAFSLLDKLFGGDDFQDTYYMEKRSKATVISLACNKPQVTCFCTSLKGRPDNEEGADIILFDIGENILVRPITKKGEKFIESLSSWFEDAKEADIKKKNEIMVQSFQKIRSTADIQNIKEKLDKAFDISFWNEIHQKCLGCGICTYLCPTCYCFNITDEIERTAGSSTSSGGKRIRCWDSCMFSLFTMHASGHNPRPSYKERMRQRIMHKFNYCPENFKEIFCIGCGRCVRNCPVNLDLREMLILLMSFEEIKEDEKV